MPNQEQITVRFESTLDNELAEDNSLLLSGPIKVQLVMDTFAELTSAEGVEVLKSALEDDSFVVAFVKDVSGYIDVTGDEFNDSILHRGAYFYFDGWIDAEETQPNWMEILLGTHSHPNLDRLNKFVTRLDEDGKIIETEESISDDEIVLQLPKLPPEIYNRLMEHRVAVKLKGNLDIQANASDITEDHLHVLGDDYYDWCGLDEAGKFANLDVVTHNELYRRLHRDSIALKLSELDPSLPNVAVQLAEYAVNYDVTQDKDGYINVSERNNEYYITVHLPWPVSSLDELFLFKNISNESSALLTPNTDYHLISLKNKDLSFSVKKVDFQEDLGTITILKLENPNKTREELSNLIDKDLVNQINMGLKLRYIEGAVEDKFELPKLYLSTDKNGNLEWSNALLPAQYFIFKEKKFTAEEIQAMDSNTLTVKFEDTNYNASTDFPLLLVNSSFIFNALYDIEVLDRATNKYNLVCKIPMVNENIVEKEYTEIGADVKLILIRKTSAESIADTVAHNYISKKDAISILSRGKLDLDDYVTREELNGLARKLHTHSEYSLRGHNHDFRYANYHHTHPEIAALLTQLLRNPNETVEEQEARYRAYLTEISEADNARLREFIRDELNITYDPTADLYSLTDRNVKLSTPTIEIFNDFIQNDLNGKIPQLNNGAYLQDAINSLLDVFREDGVDTDQVYLKRTIPVKVGIGGIKEGTLYEKDKTTLSTIIEDLLNPYIPADSDDPKYPITAKRLLTPVKYTISWYKGIDKEPLDIDNILYDAQGSDLFFKVEFTNEYGEECKSDYVITDDPINPLYGKKITQKIIPIVDNEEEPESGYFLYQHNYTFQETTYAHFNLSWKVNNDTNTIYDNYGTFPTLLNPADPIEVGEFLTVNLPDFFYGIYKENDQPVDSDRNTILGVPNKNNEALIPEFDGKEGDKIVILLEDITGIEDRLVILDINNHMEIQDYFDRGSDIMMFDGNKKYVCFFYTLGVDTDEVKLMIKLKSE